MVPAIQMALRGCGEPRLDVWTALDMVIPGLFHFRIQSRIGSNLSAEEKREAFRIALRMTASNTRPIPVMEVRGGVKLGERFHDSFLQYDSCILEEVELFQIQREQCRVNTLAMGDAEAVLGKLLGSGFPLSKASIAGHLERLSRLSSLLRLGRLLRRGILMQNDKGSFSEDRTELAFKLGKYLVKESGDFSLEVVAHVDEVNAVPAQIRQRQ